MRIEIPELPQETAKAIMARLHEQGIQYYTPKTYLPSIEGDSGEYELLTEAVELSKDVEGICVEIGVRMGMGTKHIIDAICEHRPGSTVIGIDPYGSILYTGREPNGPCRLDYTNEMAKRCMAAMIAPVQKLFEQLGWEQLKMGLKKGLWQKK